MWFSCPLWNLEHANFRQRLNQLQPPLWLPFPQGRAAELTLGPVSLVPGLGSRDSPGSSTSPTKDSVMGCGYWAACVELHLWPSHPSSLWHALLAQLCHIPFRCFKYQCLQMLKFLGGWLLKMFCLLESGLSTPIAFLSWKAMWEAVEEGAENLIRNNYDLRKQNFFLKTVWNWLVSWPVECLNVCLSPPNSLSEHLEYWLFLW